MSFSLVEELQFSSSMEDVQKAVLYIVTLAQKAGMTKDAADDLRVAVEELLVNIHLYAYSSGPGPIVVQCQKYQNLFRVELRDQGPGFDPVKWSERVTMQDGIEDKADGGMGITLAKGLVDAFSYERSGQTNVVTLTKGLSGGTS